MSAGFSQERLGRLRGALAGHVESGEIPGLVALVHRRGETRVEAVGSMTAGGERPVRRQLTAPIR